MSAALELVQAPPRTDTIEGLSALLEPVFLETVGWNPDQVSLTLEPGPIFRNHRCPSKGCHRVADNSKGACNGCVYQAKTRKVPIEEIIRDGPNLKSDQAIPLAACDVQGCGRIRNYGRLCVTHHRRRLVRKMSPAAYIATNPEPFASYGECVVSACLRIAVSRNSFCSAHRQRWQDDAKLDPTLKPKSWAISQPALDWDVIVSMRGIPEFVRMQLLVGLQKRLGDGGDIRLAPLRALIRYLQQGQYLDIMNAPVPEKSGACWWLLRNVQEHLHVISTSVEMAVLEDTWDLRIFGAHGVLDFTVLEQDWLREAAKQWATEVISRLRDRFAVVIRDVITTCRYLSSTLAERSDHGAFPAALERRDMINHLNRLKRWEHDGQITAHHRTNLLRNLRRFLADCRDMRLIDPGRPLHGLASDFVLFQTDVPQPPLDDSTARDLPAAVLQTLTSALDVLEAEANAMIRRLTEILMDTGRRPEEICSLPWDCLTSGEDGKWVLIWTNHKANRANRRLPIHDDTAAIIQAQQSDMLDQYPKTPRHKLVLFPRGKDNHEGTFSISGASYGQYHRKWVRGFPAVHTASIPRRSGTIKQMQVPFVDDVGQPFDINKIQPYAYRHTYCQRHADQGTGPDVLRELLDHRSMTTTQIYYRVREKRLRTAVDRIYASQVDNHGKTVWSSLATEIDDATRARMQIGEIAVPYGVCTEPSNIKAAGAACPYKFTCIACSHFRSDPSYLPELRAYHDRLLETRQRIRAARDLDTWARNKVDPADEEISAVSKLVTKLERSAERMTQEDRDLLDRAVQLVRSARRNVDLGMPGRPTPTDPRAVHIR